MEILMNGVEIMESSPNFDFTLRAIEIVKMANSEQITAILEILNSD